MALFEDGDVKSAIEIFRRAIEIDPSDKEMYFGLGGALKEDGDVDGAIENYRKVIELDPRFYEAYSNLSCLSL